jgi:hypothetical protein
MNQDTVTVYSYSYYDRLAEGYMVSSWKAPLPMIRDTLHSEPVELTAEEVPADEIGADGFYRRVASGWGSLD